MNSFAAELYLSAFVTSSKMQRPHWRSVLGLSGGKSFTTCCTILSKACKKLVDLTKDEEALAGFEPGTGHAAVACSTNWAIRAHLATFLQLLYRNLRLFSPDFSQSDAWNAVRTSNPWFLKWLSIGAEPCSRADNRIWKAYFCSFVECGVEADKQLIAVHATSTIFPYL